MPASTGKTLPVAPRILPQMSWLVAALYDRVMGPPERACVSGWREELLGTMAGNVLEIGAGTGYNVPHYPATVGRLTLAEPDGAMRKRLAVTCESGDSIAVRDRVAIVDATAEALPFADASFDAVVGTFVLCTVKSPAAVLSEVRRVLKPSGAYVFLEHGAAAEGSARLRWQQRLEPVWRVAADGCHLTRRADEAIAEAGLGIERVERESMRRAAPFLRPTVRGIARR
jgi:ubiquinone/menaquinone biosynthesis C-methylase UbiE